MKILITEAPKERLPAGKHNVRIVKIVKGTTSNGLEYFECFFENNQGTCTSRFYITEKSLFRVISIFRACNLSAEKLKIEAVAIFFVAIKVKSSILTKMRFHADLQRFLCEPLSRLCSVLWRPLLRVLSIWTAEQL